MKYYKVKPECSQKKVCDITNKRVVTTLFANELYTEKEFIKRGLITYSDYFDIVEISKQRTFFLFGARFEGYLSKRII